MNMEEGDSKIIGTVRLFMMKGSYIHFRDDQGK